MKANSNDISLYPPREAKKPQERSPLLPAAELANNLRPQPSPIDVQSKEPQERPRSALHTGDFTQDEPTGHQSTQEPPYGSVYPVTNNRDGFLSTSPTTPWYTPVSSFPTSGISQYVDSPGTRPDRRPWRSRAPSLNSYSSSSYVLKAPTTPLVQQSNNTDLDFSPRDRSMSPAKSSRRRTLPPHAFQNMHTESNLSTSRQLNHNPPSNLREGSLSYGHRPQKSLTSNWSLQAFSSPQTPPYLRSRRISTSSETSPLQHASMVGSYEESILRGWMSTAPSKPLHFTAKIGVLGRGNSKPKCPAHVTIPFPAVFYSWSNGNGRSAMSDDPSPYVGHIDLQHSMTPKGPRNARGSKVEIGGESGLHDLVTDQDLKATTNHGIRKLRKRRRGSPSAVPPGGSYRIPQQGQIQVIIKNPNKTAVKLFLIPYDLEGMAPGTKTFVRQRSYSADPVIDSPLVSKSPAHSASFSKKPTLRYLIHLNICSPSKGRFHLYQQIRVVFANRVPDNKEQLKNEIQLPQPRFSAYRPNRESLSGTGSIAGSKSTAEKAFRRGSSGFNFNTENLASQAMQSSSGPSFVSFNNGSVPPVPAIPFSIPTLRQKPGAEDDEGEADIMELDQSRPTTLDDSPSSLSDKTNRMTGMPSSSSYKSNSSQGSFHYNKLSKGDLGYGGFSRPVTPEPREGLLARKLKVLGVRQGAKDAEDDV